MFKCKNCGKEFPVVAWIEMATTTYPTFPNWQGANSVTVNVTWTNQQSTTTMKKPVCPYCQSLDLEEYFVPRIDGTCPKCGSDKVHRTELHECSTGTPMKCDACYHTWCA